MPHRTFLAFVLPSLLVMLLFIALPLVSVVIQSLHVEHEKIMVEVETSGPFGTTKELRVDQAAMAELQESQPLGRFAWFETYTNRAHLATADIGAILGSDRSPRQKLAAVMNLPFYKALIFTLSYTFIVTPLVIVIGLAAALAINAVPRIIKGPVIFFSLLPMIVTPLVGSLILFWMIDAQGIIGATIARLLGDPGLSLKASPTLTWLTLFTYGVWHSAPFAFVVFYAGLQTVPQDTLESAMIDGASRWERVRYVIIPHLAPLATFIALMQLMDNFRVFEPIIGFSAAASATSLSWLIYNDLRINETPLFGSAAATSVMTIIGVILLLSPVLLRTWRAQAR